MPSCLDQSKEKIAAHAKTETAMAAFLTFFMGFLHFAQNADARPSLLAYFALLDPDQSNRKFNGNAGNVPVTADIVDGSLTVAAMYWLVYLRIEASKSWRRSQKKIASQRSQMGWPMSMSAHLDSPFVVFAIALVAQAVAAYIGDFLRKHAQPFRQGERHDFNTVQAATLTLLAGCWKRRSLRGYERDSISPKRFGG
jgi:hypothetical protein